MAVARTIIQLGNLAVRPVTGVGAFTIFFSKSLHRIFAPPVSMVLLMRQLEFVGNRSAGIIFISSGMIGAIFGLILGEIFRTFSAASMLGAASAIAFTKELAPLFVGFLVTARAGSSMAAEIGTMRVNEQIDAMRVMAVNPYGYLVAPRVAAGIIMCPMLCLLAIVTGVAASFGAGVLFFDVDVGTFFAKLQWLVKPKYILDGCVKAAVFGAVLTSIGCYKGFHASGGAKGVGRATTEAVVFSLVSIIVVDFFLSYLQFDKPL